jgi:uncharacterized protein (UPF0276 family)
MERVLRLILRLHFHLLGIVVRFLGRVVVRRRMRRRMRRVRELEMPDLFGLGWRPELAPSVLAHRDQIDVVEVIADDYFDAPGSAIRALRTLSREVPTVLHGVGLGAASTASVARRRHDQMARVVDAVQPRFWSEHLAFVRAGGVEIGHLAAPPRNAATVDGTAANVEACRRVVGSSPLLENIATLLAPPGSDRSESAWIADSLRAADCRLLLDLHNLHANLSNFGGDSRDFLDALPVERIGAIHLAGGRRIETPDGRKTRILDDHLHAVPDAVYDLLTEVGRRAPQPLVVILERDGRYPPFHELLEEIARARMALAAGRRASPMRAIA